MSDADAAEIGKLFHEAEEAREDSVTDTRNFSEENSPSRNASDDADKDNIPPASGCAWCEAKFRPGQTRFPIIVDWFGGYFDSGFRMRAIIASLCMDCFKDAYDTASSCSGARLPRFGTVCRGCGEPMQTIKSRCRHWDFCSRRCYQRDYRKRRRAGGDSAVDWKSNRPHPYCAVCKKSLAHYGKEPPRTDAVYCSSKCRQWAYRRRKSRP